MEENIKHKNITILIAEDEESNFLLLQTILKRQCKVLHAMTGKELLEIYKKEHADLILMDIKMPEMNGIDALKEIRKFDKDIPLSCNRPMPLKMIWKRHVRPEVMSL